MQTDPRAHAQTGTLHGYLAGIKTISDAWDAYRMAVIPPAAPDVQVLETRRAFYAAADWALKRLLDASENEEAGEALLSGFMRELAEFGAEAKEIAERYQRGECDRLGRALPPALAKRAKKGRKLRGNDARRAAQFGAFTAPKGRKPKKRGKGK
jgi:hypothetical protein